MRDATASSTAQTTAPDDVAASSTATAQAARGGNDAVNDKGVRNAHRAGDGIGSGRATVSQFRPRLWPRLRNTGNGFGHVPDFGIGTKAMASANAAAAAPASLAGAGYDTGDDIGDERRLSQRYRRRLRTMAPAQTTTMTTDADNGYDDGVGNGHGATVTT